MSWRWARSADTATWSTIPGADAAAYTPTDADVGHHLQATAVYSDPHAAGKTAAAVSVNQVRAAPEDNGPPVFEDGSSTTRLVAENAPPGTAVGAPVAASDPDSDTVTYTLAGRGRRPLRDQRQRPGRRRGGGGARL